MSARTKAPPPESMTLGRNKCVSVGNNPRVAASTLGAEGNGTTHAKSVPCPVKRVSITRRSSPFDHHSNAR